MTSVLEIVSRLEAAGGTLLLAGNRIQYRVPRGNSEIQSFLAELRKHRSELAALLKARNAEPEMPPGVRLLEWMLKDPPVAIETCSVVTDHLCLLVPRLNSCGSPLLTQSDG